MRTKRGTITSAKMTGTVTVTVHRSSFHPIYKKRFRISTKFLADSRGIEDLGVGDMVEITECRPLSKRKCFKVTEVLKRVPRVSEMAEESSLAAAMQSKTPSSDSAASSDSSDSSSK
jgi:small subunit ribosomal protein S17